VLVDWIRAVIATPLPALGVPLAALRRPLVEMEFWLPAQRLLAGEVDALCRHHLLDGEPRPSLPQRELRGMLMGFADLVLEHEGRYWVLDYKSNWLGASGTAYRTPALRAAMAHHRYDVQAALYLLALHRLLRTRLGAAYDPTRQLGGALYYFIRGVDGPTRGEYLIAANPGTLNLLDELDRLLDPDDRRLAAEETAQ
jgi:exodeoxyribonuclease V beta subunit